MSRVTVIATGGTIATTADADGVRRPTQDGAQLTEGLDVDVVEVMCKDSSELAPADWDLIAAAVRAAADGGVRGVVVTHGTDTLEETAMLCDVMHDAEAPIVFTGAIRAASAPGADGPANLMDAVSVARSEEAVGMGVLVVFGGEIHHARFAQHGREVGDGLDIVLGDFRRAVAAGPAETLRRLHGGIGFGVDTRHDEATVADRWLFSLGLILYPRLHFD